MARAAKPETEFELDDAGPTDYRPANETTLPTELGGRYRIQEWLGQGGMASVYRGLDPHTGRTLAIKHCSHAQDTRDGRELCALFEREFHLLAQLSHPRVIEVYDYGVDNGRPYYTMELLDGGDLRELSPLPWRQVCALIYDVCSSLALLHSRRFVHRDIGPRNVRCTRAGDAKLIDFGAAVPMGVAQHIVGTAPYVAPEALSRIALDARADLFAVGATCYYALTGEQAFHAQHLSELNDAWSVSPYRPSELVEDVPVALDELVMSLLSLDPAQRPRSAFEVMLRLSAIAGLPQAESLAVPRAYLSAPATVGRDRELNVLREKIVASVSARADFRLLIATATGAGRSHLLDSAALMGKTLGATVLRAGAQAGARRFAVAQTVIAQLCERAPATTLAAANDESVAELLFQPMTERAVAPQARTLEDSGEQATVSDALARLLSAVGRTAPLLLIVDDVHDIDDASLLLLTTLAQASTTQRISLLLACEEAALQARHALHAMARYCEPLPLPPLDAAATTQLVTSLFGDVANAAFVSHEIYQRAHGNPGATLWSAQWLVDHGAICYEGGTWTLPVQLSAAELPLSHEQAVIEHLAELSPLARDLAECQALAVQGVFSHDDFLRLAAEESARAVERALIELASAGVVQGDGRRYRLQHPEYARLLLAQDRPQERQRQHSALARMYMAPEMPPVYAVPHLLACGQDQMALDRLLEHFGHEDRQVGDLAANHRLPLSPDVLAKIYMQCLACAERLDAPVRTRCELYRHLVLISVIEDEACYRVAAPRWLAQLERDCGLTRYRELDASLPVLDRLGQAYHAAQAQFEGTPGAIRGYAPDEAIRLLVQYVVLSIAVAARSLDVPLVLSLPPLLEPFAPLSPIIAAIRNNAQATCEYMQSRQLPARERWLQVYDSLEQVSGDELRYVTGIRNAIAFALGTIEVGVGGQDVERWSNKLDNDPMQRVDAMYLRKLSALQRGDWDAAEQFRKRAELLAVQDRTQQMFTILLTDELMSHSLGRDLSGLKYVLERIEAVAERYPRWRPVAGFARGSFQYLRGNVQRARSELEECLRASDPRLAPDNALLPAFCPAAAAYVEVLDALDQGGELALTWGYPALEHLQALGVDIMTWDLVRAIAQVEARQPARVDAARQRLEALLATQREAGSRGLRLGATYEACARVAIHTGDTRAAVDYARLTASEYRHGLGSALGARYERLREEARRAGIELPS